ncbi:putative uncharacterized protein FLJ45355 [Melospiza georgiana]|uniref:putative uncharacterized protein FLJ45355 n=1 Tax=Melospiza georgiana TaxID=44398 RepID=UPI0025AC00BE|nr:putative uncharacterized protein FLJ45355 [Melospiza georgiana]
MAAEAQPPPAPLRSAPRPPRAAAPPLRGGLGAPPSSPARGERALPAHWLRASRGPQLALVTERAGLAAPPPPALSRRDRGSPDGSGAVPAGSERSWPLQGSPGGIVALPTASPLRPGSGRASGCSCKRSGAAGRAEVPSGPRGSGGLVLWRGKRGVPAAAASAALGRGAPVTGERKRQGEKKTTQQPKTNIGHA